MNQYQQLAKAFRNPATAAASPGYPAAQMIDGAEFRRSSCGTRRAEFQYKEGRFAVYGVPEGHFVEKVLFGELPMGADFVAAARDLMRDRPNVWQPDGDGNYGV